MEFSARDIRTGLFVLISLAILFAGLYIAGGGYTGLGERKGYIVHFENIALLAERTQVAYAGVPVGQISGIRQLESPTAEGAVAEAEILVDARLRIRASDRVVITSDGLIGEKYLDIIPGGVGEVLPEGSVLPGAFGGLDGVMRRAGGLVTSVQDAMGQIEGLATDLKGIATDVSGLVAKVEVLLEENREGLQGTLAGAKDLIQENRKGLRDLLKEIDSRVVEVEPVLQEFGGLAREAREKMSGTLDSIQASVARLEGLIDRTEDLVVTADPKVLEALDHLRVASRHLEEATAKVNSDPSILIWGTDDEERAGAGISPEEEDRPWIGPGDEEE